MDGRAVRSDIMTVLEAVRTEGRNLPCALAAIGYDFLVRTQRAMSGKVRHGLMQYITVGRPETQCLAFGFQPVFTTKFQDSSILIQVHGYAPCLQCPVARALRH